MLQSRCVRDHAGLCALYEDALVHHCQPVLFLLTIQGLPLIIHPKHKRKPQTRLQLPAQYQHQRLHPVHDDPMARLLSLPPPLLDKLVLRHLEGIQRDRFSPDLIHSAYRVYHALCDDGG